MSSLSRDYFLDCAHKVALQDKDILEYGKVAWKDKDIFRVWENSLER